MDIDLNNMETVRSNGTTSHHDNDLDIHGIMEGNSDNINVNENHRILHNNNGNEIEYFSNVEMNAEMNGINGMNGVRNEVESDDDEIEDEDDEEEEEPSGAFANVGQGLTGKYKTMMMQYWQNTIDSIENDEHDFKNHQLPLARIKKVMKTDEEVKMISAEAPILFAKGCDIFITELTMRAWIHAEENKRRTLQKSDIAAALQKSDMFDFLIDIVPREEERRRKSSTDGLGFPQSASEIDGHQEQYSIPDTDNNQQFEDDPIYREYYQSSQFEDVPHHQQPHQSSSVEHGIYHAQQQQPHQEHYEYQ